MLNLKKKKSCISENTLFTVFIQSVLESGNVILALEYLLFLTLDKEN